MSVSRKDIDAAIDRGQAAKREREEARESVLRQERQELRDHRRSLVDAIHAHLVGGALVAFIEKHEAAGESAVDLASSEEEFALLTRSRGDSSHLREALGRIEGIHVSGALGSRTLHITWKRGDTE